MTSEPRVAAGDASGATPEGWFDLAAHHCFACGELNEHGIRMPLHIEPDRAWSELVLDPTFQGWDGIAHGGILATLLDEAGAWAIASREAFGFTARLSIEYRRPVPVGAAIRVQGRVVEARRRVLRTEASITDPMTGEEYARADGVYIRAPEEQQRELRGSYRFAGATDGSGGERRWRVRQSLPAVDPGGGDTPGSVVLPPDAAAGARGPAADARGSLAPEAGAPGRTSTIGVPDAAERTAR